MGKNQDLGSGINIPDPQHCSQWLARIHWLLCFFQVLNDRKLWSSLWHREMTLFGGRGVGGCGIVNLVFTPYWMWVLVGPLHLSSSLLGSVELPHGAWSRLKSRTYPATNNPSSLLTIATYPSSIRCSRVLHTYESFVCLQWNFCFQSLLKMANTVKDIPVQLKQPKKEAKESSIGDRPMTKKVDFEMDQWQRR